RLHSARFTRSSLRRGRIRTWNIHFIYLSFLSFSLPLSLSLSPPSLYFSLTLFSSLSLTLSPYLALFLFLSLSLVSLSRTIRPVAHQKVHLVQVVVHLLHQLIGRGRCRRVFGRGNTERKCSYWSFTYGKNQCRRMFPTHC